jgi:hypothetical protein
VVTGSIRVTSTKLSGTCGIDSLFCDANCDVTSLRTQGNAPICSSGAKALKMGLITVRRCFAAYCGLSTPVSVSELTLWRSAVRARTGLPSIPLNLLSNSRFLFAQLL